MPLAHLLAPQIARKVEEIETALGRPPSMPPPSGGYLNSQGDVGTRAKAPPGETVPPTERYTNSLGQIAINAALKGAHDAALRQRHPATGSRQMLIPNTPAPTTEALPKNNRGQLVLPAHPGEAVGQTEAGEPVDVRGRKVGYLSQPNGGPAGPVQAYRFGGARGEAYLQQKYGPHLKAMQDNRDERGMPTDQFPQGYFKGVSKAERRDIEEGVGALMMIERDARRMI